MMHLKYKATTAAPYIIAGLSLFYFLFHMISGDRGLVSYIRAKSEYKLLSTELSLVNATNAALENKINLLKDDSVDYDMLEEQAIKTLGLARKGDIVIFLKNKAE